jgi:hypothetical protein
MVSRPNASRSGSACWPGPSGRESAGALLFRSPAVLAGPAAELAATEQRCCAFFEFTLRLADGALELEVHAPAEAAPLLADMFGVAD